MSRAPHAYTHQASYTMGIAIENNVSVTFHANSGDDTKLFMCSFYLSVSTSVEIRHCVH